MARLPAAQIQDRSPRRAATPSFASAAGWPRVPPHDGEVVVSLSPDRQEPRPEFEQLRRWFEARGGRLGALLETERWSPNGVGAEGSVSIAATPPPVADRDARKPRSWLKAMVAVIAAAAILTGGAWLGQTLRTPERSSVQAPAGQPVTRTVTRTVAPVSCLAALRQSDAAIRLLSGRVRDRRLDRAIAAYQKSREDCRKQTAAGRSASAGQP
jgi:hypothetical protein